MSETTTTRPDHDHDQVLDTEPGVSPEGITRTIDENPTLLAMRHQAREIYEFNDDEPTSRNQKVSRLEQFAEALQNFQDTGYTLADPISERFIAIAETPEGYIQDTEDLKQMRDEAQEIADFDDEGVPTRRNEKTKKLEDLAEQLNHFDETTSIGETNKQAVIDTIVTTAEPLPPEDEPHEPDEPDQPDEEIPTLTPEDEAARQRRMMALDRINAADRLHGYQRVMALGNIALELNGIGHGGGDLGIEAAKRIKRSKNSDYYLHKMAVRGNNLEAAQAMAHGGYLRNKTIDKGRNDALREVTRNSTNPAEALDIINSEMRGLGARKYRYDAISDIAERNADPALLESIAGMYQLLRKQEAVAKTAVAMARKGQHDRALDLASRTIKFPKTRNKALYDIHEIIGS